MNQITPWWLFLICSSLAFNLEEKVFLDINSSDLKCNEDKTTPEPTSPTEKATTTIQYTFQNSNITFTTANSVDSNVTYSWTTVGSGDDGTFDTTTIDPENELISYEQILEEHGRNLTEENEQEERRFRWRKMLEKRNFRKSQLYM